VIVFGIISAVPKLDIKNLPVLTLGSSTNETAVYAIGGKVAIRIMITVFRK